MNGNIAIAETPSYVDDSSSPSYELAQRFSGVALPNDATPEQRRKLVNSYIEFYHMLERLGWYDHTSDWDFHIGIRLNDGRSDDHIGDGATIEWNGGADEFVYSGADSRTAVRLHPAADESEPDPLNQYRDGESYIIPVEEIAEIGFGYCT